MTYSSIVYRLRTRAQQQRTMSLLNGLCPSWY